LKYRHIFSVAILTLMATCLICGTGVTAYFRTSAQQSTDAQNAAASTIRVESRLVLVDVVVTDKKGGYLEDLTEKDFRVWQDDQEQKVSSFSFEQSAAATNQSRHLVLFFDNDSMKITDQMRARAAAGKFLEGNSRKGNYIAVIDYAGTMHVAQNFTDDTEQLRKMVAASRLSTAQSESASLGSPVFSSYDSYSNRNVLLALRSVGKSLASMPGRKSLVWLTSGFTLTADGEAEMTALINTCNKANVAVYAVDVRGLPGAVTSSLRTTSPEVTEAAVYSAAAVPVSERENAEAPHLVYVAQTKTGGGGGATTGNRTGGTTTTSRPKTIAPPPAWTQNPLGQPRSIVPPLPPSTAINQQVLYAVAIGTGGFVISNNNDLASGLDKIAREQSEYYILGYVPPESHEGSCHTLRVKVERSGAQVRARSGYCDSKPLDYLAGKPVARQLEEHARGNQTGAIPASALAPYFYTSPETARVNLALEIPGKAIQFDKAKGKYHAVVNVLGIAVKPDGTVAARFSDTVDLNLEKNEMEDFQNHSYHYENQFYIAGGQYSLKLALNSGEKFGQFELPLVVDHYDPKNFGISDLALSKQFYRVSDMSTALDSQLLQDRTPLVTQGLQMVPSASSRFKTSDRVAIYLEVYEPLIADASAPRVGLRLRIMDKKTGEQRLEAGVPDTASSVIPGNPVIPMGVPLPVDRLQPGTYVVELRATDSAGHSSAVRKAEFSVE